MNPKSNTFENLRNYLTFDAIKKYKNIFEILKTILEVIEFYFFGNPRSDLDSNVKKNQLSN